MPCDAEIIMTNENGPLPLATLHKWISMEETYRWLKNADKEAEELRKEIEEDGGGFDLFESAIEKEEKENAINERIRRWKTSLVNINGIFIDDNNEENDRAEGIEIIYILSDVLAGFGNVVWSSSRFIANVLANPDKCREILGPLISQETSLGKTDLDNSHHPLLGLTVVELGAGAGIPSWTCMCCGARVVSTDQAAPDRIRCMAECMERNWRNISTKYKVAGDNDAKSDDNDRVSTMKYASKAKCCPHDWGTPVDEVLQTLNSSGDERFDLVVAADCCYMPWLHNELLDSIRMLMSHRGVALICFALHGNTDDDDVWKIVDRAKEKGFQVEKLDSQQLAPPNSDMDAKQGLVHTLRLTRPQS